MGVETQGQPVDLAHLALYTGGNFRLNAEVLAIFAEQTNGHLARLEAALRQRDAKGWREVMHALKGASRGIGAFALGDAAAKAEPLDPAAAANQACDALRALRTRSQAVKRFIDAYLAA